jgi:integrase/recombinase XerD
MFTSTRIETNEWLSQQLLDTDVEDFITHLRSAGYARRTLRKKRSVAKAFARWSRHRKLAVAALNESHVDKFLARSRRRGKARRAFEAAALGPFLRFLRASTRVAITAPPAQSHPRFELEQRYIDFLRDERGLSENSVRVYAPSVHHFLRDVMVKHGSASSRKLNLRKVQSFLIISARGRSSEWTRLLATALRSFLRFLYRCGETDIDFSVSVPTVRKWAQATVPPCLSAEDVERAISVPDRSTNLGRRDYAILLLLARLGLRAGEIVAVELADIRWRTAGIVIHGKGQQVDNVPLPADVGRAVADYLCAGRGRSASRKVFLRSHAPWVALAGPAAVGHIVRKVLVCAGLCRKSRGAAHIFRHSLASRMIQQGARINEIAEVLRHRSQNTTEIYAKVDIGSLREVARPWPRMGGER